MKNPYIVVLCILLALGWLLFTPIKKAFKVSSIMEVEAVEQSTSVADVQKLQNSYEVAPQYSVVNENIPTTQTRNETIDGRVIKKIISGKENIQLIGYNFFKLDSDSNDAFYLYKNKDGTTHIKLGLTEYKIEVNNPELSTILCKIQNQQGELMKKREEERILKAIGE